MWKLKCNFDQLQDQPVWDHTLIHYGRLVDLNAHNFDVNEQIKQELWRKRTSAKINILNVNYFCFVSLPKKISNIFFLLLLLFLIDVIFSQFV